MATSKIYVGAAYNMFAGATAAWQGYDYLSDTVKVALTTSTNGISQTADSVFADLTNESSGTGYTAGGATLGTKTVGVASLTTTVDAADTTWTTVSITAGQAHVWDDTLTNPVDPLICYQDFGGNQVMVAADFVIQWNASGIFTVAVA